jgi:hypothetical protein
VNWKELVSPRNEERLQLVSSNEDKRIIHKMELSKKYYNGEECPYGDKCSFLHRVWFFLLCLIFSSFVCDINLPLLM